MSGSKMAKGPFSNLLFLYSMSLIACFQPGKASPIVKRCYGGGGGNINNNSNVKGMFVFGSSIVDNGNNNFITNTLAKASYSPYGIDFSLGPSGRFTNGKNVIDLLGNKLQLPDYLPVFNDPLTTGTRILHGVNYASGGSGILDNTGSIAGRVIGLNEQIGNFGQVTLPELERQVGNNGSKQLLADSIFVVGSGSNDYTLNYFLTGEQQVTNITLDAFTANLTSTLASQLQKLYSKGARRFVILAVYPLGCIPSVRARQPSGACSRILNRAARLFNAKLRRLLDFITPQLPGSTFVYVNSYKIIMDIIINPSAKGFSNVSNPCCQVSSTNEGGNGISCKRGGTTCENRSVYLYFDGLHPTEALNEVLATKAFTSNLRAEVYPFNVQHLARI